MTGFADLSEGHRWSTVGLGSSENKPHRRFGNSTRRSTPSIQSISHSEGREKTKIIAYRCIEVIIVEIDRIFAGIEIEILSKAIGDHRCAERH